MGSHSPTLHRDVSDCLQVYAYQLLFEHFQQSCQNMTKNEGFGRVMTDMEGFGRIWKELEDFE